MTAPVLSADSSASTASKPSRTPVGKLLRRQLETVHTNRSPRDALNSPSRCPRCRGRRVRDLLERCAPKSSSGSRGLTRSPQHWEGHRYEVNGRRVYLLQTNGTLANLAAGRGTGPSRLFDPFAAIMLLDAILPGQTRDLSPGAQRYPAELETRVASALVDSRSATPAMGSRLGGCCIDGGAPVR